MEGQQGTGRNWWKIGGIGCLSVFGLGTLLIVAVVVIIAAASGGGGGSGPPVGEQDGGSQEQEAGQEQAGQQEQQAEQSASMGEAVSVGGTTWVATQANQTSRLTDSMGESKQGNFVRVSFEFTNDGSEAITLDSEMLTLLDEQGNEYQVDTDNMMYVPMENSIFLEQVNPGVNKTGTAIFSVGPEAQPSSLRVSEGMFGTNTRQIELNNIQVQQ